LPADHVLLKRFAWSLGCALLLLWGCAPKKPPLPETPPQPASRTWEQFRARIEGQTFSQGFSISSSLHLISSSRQDRVTFQAWGNYDLPIRLDLKAGLGTTFSMWRVTKEQWLAYYPGQNKAFVHDESRIGASRLGFRSPFDLQELTFIFSGDWRMILPQQYSSSSYDPEFGWCFTFGPEQKVSSVSISPELNVTRLTGTWPSDWTMRLDDHALQAGQRIPGKILLQAGPNQKAIVHIKKVEFRKPWPDKALSLELPAETELIFLSKEKEVSP